VTGRRAMPVSVGSIPIACSNHPERCSGLPAGGRVVVDTLVFQTRPPGSIPTARSNRDYQLRSADRERSTTASQATRPVSIATTKPGGRRAPAPGRAVVVRSTGNPGQAGRGRDDVAPRSASRIRTTPECATWSIATRRRLRSCRLRSRVELSAPRRCSEGAAHCDRCRCGNTPVFGTEAQQVERPFVKRMGAGSNPAGPATQAHAATGLYEPLPVSLGVAQQESTCLGSKGAVVRIHSPRL
jgi:hypothetical protein